MENRILTGYESFEKKNLPRSESNLLPYSKGFMDGVISEKERMKERLLKVLKPFAEKHVFEKGKQIDLDSSVDWVAVTLDNIVNSIVEGSDG